MLNILKVTFSLCLFLSVTTSQAQVSSDSVLWFQPGEAGFWNGGAEEYFMYFCQTPPNLDLPGFPNQRCDFSGIWFDFNSSEFKLEVTDFLLDANGNFYVVNNGDVFSRQATINDQFSHIIEFNLGSTSIESPSLLLEYENENDYLPASASYLREIGFSEADIAGFYFRNGGTAADAFIGLATSIFSSVSVEERTSYGWVQFRVLPNPDNPTDFQINHLGVDRFVLEMVDHALAFDSDGIIVGTRISLPVPEPTTCGLLMLGTMFFIGFDNKRVARAHAASAKKFSNTKRGNRCA